MKLNSILGWGVGVLVASGFAQASLVDQAPVTQPSVNRTLVICDHWQWIGNGAVTWGCVSQPRRAGIAGGQVTDEVVLSLQNQINALRAEVEALKRP